MGLFLGLRLPIPHPDGARVEEINPCGAPTKCARQYARCRLLLRVVSLGTRIIPVLQKQKQKQRPGQGQDQGATDAQERQQFKRTMGSRHLYDARPPSHPLYLGTPQIPAPHVLISARSRVTGPAEVDFLMGWACKHSHFTDEKTEVQR